MAKLLQENHIKPWHLLVTAVATLILIVAMARFLPAAVDWHTAFRPAARLLLTGHSPYNNEHYFNAPWALIPLIPLALLPEAIGRACLVLVNILAIAFVAHRLKASLGGVLLILVSPPMLHGILNGNIDWLAALGFILPLPIGLFFISIKPQMGIAVGLFWLIDVWWQQGWRAVLRQFLPFGTVLLLSFALFGLWPLRFEREVDLWWNASLWPLSLPVGLALLVAAIRTRRIEFSMAASPCLSPYVLLHSWIGALLGLSARLPELAAAVFGLWLLILLQAF